MKTNYYLFFCLCLLFSCKENTSLFINNKTDKPIYYSYSPSELLNYSNKIPYYDNEGNRQLVDTFSNRVQSVSMVSVPNNASWDDDIQRNYGGRINFFFFSADTLQRYTWEEIMSRNLYTKRQSYTVKELEKLNWIISYPSNHELPKAIPWDKH